MSRSMDVRLLLLLLGLAWTSPAATLAADPPREARILDLPSVLQLAGAGNLDVAIARERLSEATASRQGTSWQFFPWIAPGFAYRAHDNRIQNVEGRIIDVHRDA